MTYTQAVEERILQFKGATFSSPEDVEAWLRSFALSIKQATIEEIEGKMPKKVEHIEECKQRMEKDFRFDCDCGAYWINDTLSELRTLLETMKEKA